MRACPRHVDVFAVLAVAVVLGAGCGDNGSDSGGIEFSGANARDERIAADLNSYIERNYGRAENYPQADEPNSEPPDLPPRQRRALAELSDNVAQMKPSIKRIAVEARVITVETSLDSDQEGLQTARLICTVIYGADVADFVKGHEVRGRDSALLVECTPSTNPLE